MADETPQATAAEIPQGVDEVNRMRYAGASDEDVENYKSEIAHRMQSAGAGPEDVKSYFGIKDPDMAPDQAWIKGNLDRYNNVMDGGKPDTSRNLPTQHPAKTYWDSFLAGLQHGSTPLQISYPTTVLPPDADRAMRILSGIGQFAGDIPEFAKGAAIGGAAGASTGMAIGAGIGLALPIPGGLLGGAGVGATVGGGAGAMAGGFALPEAVRHSLMDHYEKGDIQTAGEYSDRLMGALWAGTKAGIAGGAAGLAGPVGGKILGTIGAKIGGEVAAAAMQGVGGLGAEITTMTTVGAALEGRLPDRNEFIDAAIALGGAHGLIHVAPKLYNIYRNTGMRPSEVMENAGNNPAIKEGLLSNDPKQPPGAGAPAPPGAGVEGGHLINPNIDAEVAEAKRHLSLVPDEPKLPTIRDYAKRQDLTFDNEGGNWVARDGRKVTPEEVADKQSRGLFSETTDGPSRIHTGKPDLVPTDIEPVGKGSGDRGEPPKPPPPPDEPGGDANKKIDDMIVDHPEHKQEGVTVAKLTQALTDNLDPAKRLVDDVTDGNLPADKDPYVVMRNFRHWSGKLLSAYTQRTIDFNTLKKTGEGLDSIVKGVDIKALTRYMVSERVLDHEARGIKHGFDVDAAKEVVARDSKEFAPIAKRLVDFQNRIVQYAVDAGLIAKKNAKRFTEMNKAFIPLHRLLDADPLTGKVQGDGSLYKATDGSVRKVLNPIETIYKVTAQVIKRAEKNRAMVALTDLPETSKWMARVLDEKDLATDERAREMFNEHGEDADAEGSQGVASIFRDDKGTLRDNEAVVMRKGVREVWAFKPELAEAIQAMDYHPGQTEMLMRLFAKPLFLAAATLRAGTVLAPGFLTRHFVRSQVIATIQSKYPHIPLDGVWDGLGHIWNHDEVWTQYVESGAPNSAVSEIHKLMESKPWELDEETGWLSATRNRLNPKQVMQLMSHLSDLSDNAARVDAFKRAGGVDGTLEQKTQGAMDARQITLDYTRIGAQIRMISGIIPFLNVGIQGTARMYGAFKENPAKYTALSAACITLPTIINFALNHNDSRYKTASDTDKRLNWIIPTDKWERAVSVADAMSRPEDLRYIGPDGHWMVNNGTTFKIPRPFELGILFGAVPEALLDRFINENPHAFDKLASTVMHGMLPNLLPSLLTPVVEQSQGKNLFTDSKLVPNQLEQYLPTEQHAEYTSETAIQVAKIIGTMPILKQTLGEFGPGTRTLANPMIVDNYIRDWSGTMGHYAVQVMDAALHAAGVGNLTVKPAYTLNDIPFIKEFVVRYPSAKSQNIQDFYNSYESSTRVLATIKLNASRGDFAAARKLMDVNPGWETKLTGISTTIANGNKFIQQVNEDPHMNKNEKRQLITTTYYEIMHAADMGNEITQKISDLAKKKK